MNSLLKRKSQNNKPSFKEFAASMTPETAKQQLEYMLTNGQITQQQLDNAKQIASMIINNK